MTLSLVAAVWLLGVAFGVLLGFVWALSVVDADVNPHR